MAWGAFTQRAGLGPCSCVGPVELCLSSAPWRDYRWPVLQAILLPSDPLDILEP